MYGGLQCARCFIFSFSSSQKPQELDEIIPTLHMRTLRLVEVKSLA